MATTPRNITVSETSVHFIALDNIPFHSLNHPDAVNASDSIRPNLNSNNNPLIIEDEHHASNLLEQPQAE